MRTDVVSAACSACPAYVVGATAHDLTPLMDEHHDRTGHRLWALSLNSEREEGR